ncbi:hypothetical protein D9M70_535340 [compost metagenome]
MSELFDRCRLSTFVVDCLCSDSQHTASEVICKVALSILAKVSELDGDLHRFIGVFREKILSVERRQVRGRILSFTEEDIQGTENCGFASSVCTN